MALGWKVLYVSKNNCLRSAYAGFIHNSYKGVKYKFGEWVTRQKGYGPLAVFNEYQLACTWLHNRQLQWKGFHFILVACEYIPSNDQKELWLSDTLKWYDLNDNLILLRKITDIFNCVNGTVCADAIRIF